MMSLMLLYEDAQPNDDDKRCHVAVRCHKQLYVLNRWPLCEPFGSALSELYDLMQQD